MTIASQTSFKKLPKTTVDTAVNWVRVHGPITAHDLCDLIQARGLVPEGSVQKQGQFWAELVSRLGQAAKEGYLDDTETVVFQHPGGGTSHRTLYRALAVKKEARLSKSEALEAENLALKAEIRELRTRNEIMSRNIDKFEAQIAHLKAVRP